MITISKMSFVAPIRDQRYPTITTRFSSPSPNYSQATPFPCPPSIKYIDCVRDIGRGAQADGNSGETKRSTVKRSRLSARGTITVVARAASANSNPKPWTLAHPSRSDPLHESLLGTCPCIFQIYIWLTTSLVNRNLFLLRLRTCIVVVGLFESMMWAASKCLL